MSTSMTSSASFTFRALGNHEHELFAEQWVPCAPEEAFPFFCDEKNLEALTPPFLHFNVIGKSTPEIEKGTLIDYRLKLHGLPIKWRTLIEEWEPPFRFIDVQLRGPYRKWHHTHEFIAQNGGTLLRDRVIYRIPFAGMSEWLLGRKIQADVSRIFTFRHEKIAERFCEKK